jgi:hypothetical protein
MSNKKPSVGVSNFNSKSWFAPLHYMLFKNQILGSLTPTEHSDDCNCKKCHSDDCKECHCYECHIKRCYDNQLHTKECDECHKEGCSECCNKDCCHSDDCIIEYDVDGIIINNEKDCSCIHSKECSKECSKSDYDDITDNNFIDTIGLVPVGIIPNFFLRFLLKNLLIPF